MGQKNLSKYKDKQHEELYFDSKDGFKVLWEHKQEGIVLPRQSAIRDGEIGQCLQEE